MGSTRMDIRHQAKFSLGETLNGYTHASSKEALPFLEFIPVFERGLIKILWQPTGIYFR